MSIKAYEASTCTHAAWRLGLSRGGRNRKYVRPSMLDNDYGEPLDQRCKETASGVLNRRWTTVTMDTNSNKATIVMKAETL